MIDYSEFIEASVKRIDTTSEPFSDLEKAQEIAGFARLLKEDVCPTFGDNPHAISQAFAVGRRRIQEKLDINLNRVQITSSVVANALARDTFDKAFDNLAEGNKRKFACQYDYAYGADLALSPIFTGIYGIRGSRAKYDAPTFHRFILGQMVSRHFLQGITLRKFDDIVRAVSTESETHRNSPESLINDNSGVSAIKQMVAKIKEYKLSRISDTLLPPYLELDFVATGASQTLELYQFLYPHSALYNEGA